jgi:O-antigen ligase
VVLGLAISVFISIYVAAAAMLFVVAYLIKERRLESVAFTAPGIRYLWTLCTLGIVASVMNDNEAGMLVTVALAVFILIGVYVRSVMTRMLFDKMIEVSCAASIFSFAVAFIQYLAYEGDIDRACSVFINANYYAAVIEIVVLFAAYQLFKPTNRKQRSFYAVVIALNSIGLYFSGCRTAVFALCAAMALMFLLHRKYKALAVFVGSCFLVAALMAVSPGVFPRMSQMGDDMGTRFAIWHRAIEDILKHPVFGEGALAFPSFHLVINKMSIVHSHSIYLEPLLSFGLSGTALILIYLKKNLSPIWKMRKDRSDRGRFVLAFGLLACVALHGLVDATAFSVQTGILLLLSLAMAGIQENPQPVLSSLSVYHLAYLQDTGSRQVRQAIYATKDRSLYSKKSA